MLPGHNRIRDSVIILQNKIQVLNNVLSRSLLCQNRLATSTHKDKLSGLLDEFRDDIITSVIFFLNLSLPQIYKFL